MYRARALAAAGLLALLAACSTTPTETPPGHYVVQPGDTLLQIARKHNQTVAALMRWNQIANANRIIVGQQLRVAAPGSTVTSSTPTTGPSTSTGTPSRPAPTVQAPAPTSGPAARAPSQQIGLIWPAQGTITRNVGNAKNGGITLANTAGTPVVASASGTVAYSGSGLRGYGNLIIVRHTNNFLTIYAHNRTLLVKEGQTVRQGQKIAEMGNSDSAQVALYFELRHNGTVVDPRSLLPKR